MLARAIPAAAVAAVTAIGLLIGGCQPIDYTVTIDYAKVGVCGNFQENPGSSPQQNQEAGEGVFVVYAIQSIANTASGAKSFAFDPTLLFVNGGGSLAGMPFSSHFTAHAQTVSAGTTAKNVGWLALNVTGDPKDLQAADDNLLYHTPNGESVLLDEVSNSTAIIGAGTCNPANVP
jgi:hypothetical protein